MYLETSLINPCNFIDYNRVLLPAYNFRHFDQFSDYEQQLRHMQSKCYKSKWQINDVAKFQFKSDFTPITMQVRNLDNLAVVFQQGSTTLKTIGTDVYTQNNIAFDAFTYLEGGNYQFEVIGGATGLIKLISEPFQVRTEWPDTLLFQYWNNSNQVKYLWEIQDFVTFRCEGVMVYDIPASLRTVYTDQPQDQVTVKGDPYRTFKMYVGQEGGFPDWIVDHLEEIIDQNNVEIDGKPFAPISGAVWNKKISERYPWAEWNISMRESVNRRAKRFEAVPATTPRPGLQERKVVEDFIIDGKLFGPIYGNANDVSYTINSIS